MNEYFLDVKGYEGVLQVSNLGRIKKLSRKWECGNRGGKRHIEEKIIKPRLSLGYPVFDVFHKGKKKILKVHRIFAIAFIPNPENKPCINHKDFNRSNFNLDNLEWVTYSENAEHARLYRKWKPTRSPKGETVHTSKLKEGDIKKIRESDLRNYELAVIYQVDRSTISRIRTKKYWKHLN